MYSQNSLNQQRSSNFVIFTVASNFSLFFFASSSIDHCSFASDVHDHDSFVSQLTQGDILFLHMSKDPNRAGEIVVFNVDGREIPIVHRVIKVILFSEKLFASHSFQYGTE
ncbi:Signal peptidase complex catalytic subunit SEC11C [Camellia lanceoleosa]|uniref:Signal peptidase complex catalytic subunit SEC11C n=1 Tax=Camellia lanceoleosa TaxID=1840588 RepID=A0ACC0HAZ6_9ERIC|nr:Signal peptidase complex catalytic subunit SEC11C [Camellia lanceoleosa]